MISLKVGKMEAFWKMLEDVELKRVSEIAKLLRVNQNCVMMVLMFLPDVIRFQALSSRFYMKIVPCWIFHINLLHPMLFYVSPNPDYAGARYLLSEYRNY